MARITKTELDRLRAIESELTDLGSSADALRREAKQILETAEADLTESGKTRVTRGGYVLQWVTAKCSVSWKSEFVRVAGAAAAKQLSADVPTKQKIEILAPVPAPVPASVSAK